METALSTITVFPDNKTEMAMYSRKIKSEILAYDQDPLKILRQFKYVQKVIDDILQDKDIREHFVIEAEKFGAKSFDHLGVKFTICEVGTKYNFKDCGDPKWFDLTTELESLKDKIKARESFLKTLPDEGTVDPDTGVFINKATKTSTTNVNVTL